MAFTAAKVAGDELTASHLATRFTEVTPIVALKSADQTSTTTVIANDTELFVALAASTTYKVDLWLLWNSPAAADFKFQWSSPSGSTGKWTITAQNLGAAAGTVYQGALDIGTQAQVEGQAADTFTRISLIVTTTNAGTLTAQWAQFAASGTTTVLAKSLMEARKMV